MKIWKLINVLDERNDKNPLPIYSTIYLFLKNIVLLIKYYSR